MCEKSYANNHISLFEKHAVIFSQKRQFISKDCVKYIPNVPRQTVITVNENKRNGCVVLER